MDILFNYFDLCDFYLKINLQNILNNFLKELQPIFYLFITDEKKCNNSLAMNFFFEQGKGRYVPLRMRSLWSPLYTPPSSSSLSGWGIITGLSNTAFFLVLSGDEVSV